MKTAMEELIDEFRHLCYDKDFHLGLSGIKVTQEIIDGLEKKYLDKEKEQIINAFEVGYKSCDIDEAFEINRKLASGEKYYNQKYQNK